MFTFRVSKTNVVRGTVLGTGLACVGQGEVIEKLDSDSLEMMGMTSQGRFIEFCSSVEFEMSSLHSLP